MILAAGEQEAVVISPGGSILATIELPGPPTHVLIREDFSNDGLTDLILVTSSGVYGFVQTRQPGALFFSVLIGYLIVVMGIIFVTQHINSMKGKPRPSSGPRWNAEPEIYTRWTLQALTNEAEDKAMCTSNGSSRLLKMHRM
jgi:hypothetical protein